MKKFFSSFIYFFIAATLIFDGLIVKYFLVDTDLGARFKNFNHQLLVSDILFLYALFLGTIGLIIHAIRSSEKSTLKDSTIILSAILIIPMTLVLEMTPIFETLYPGKVGDGLLSSVFSWLTSIGTFAAMAWIVMLPVNIIKQTYLILTSKAEKIQPTVFNNDSHSSLTKQFKIKENGFKEVRQKILIRTIPLVFISGMVGLLILKYSPSYNANTEINVFPFVIPVILCAFAFGIIKAIYRQKTMYESYKLEIDDSGITREQVNTPVIRILFTEINSITKNSQGGLVITGNSLANSILVPTQTQDLEVLENILLANCSVTISSSKSMIQRLMIPLIIAVLGLMAITYISTNKILVSVSGILLIAFMIFSFIQIQMNKNIDSRTRKSSYWVIIVIISIIGIIASKFMN